MIRSGSKREDARKREGEERRGMRGALDGDMYRSGEPPRNASPHEEDKDHNRAMNARQFGDAQTCAPSDDDAPGRLT